MLMFCERHNTAASTHCNEYNLKTPTASKPLNQITAELYKCKQQSYFWTNTKQLALTTTESCGIVCYKSKTSIYVLNIYINQLTRCGIGTSTGRSRVQSPRFFTQYCRVVVWFVARTSSEQHLANNFSAKIVLNRFYWRTKMHQIQFWLELCHRPHGRVYSTLLDLSPGLRWPIHGTAERERHGKEEARSGEEEKRKRTCRFENMDVPICCGYVQSKHGQEMHYDKK